MTPPRARQPGAPNWYLRTFRYPSIRKPLATTAKETVAIQDQRLSLVGDGFRDLGCVADVQRRRRACLCRNRSRAGDMTDRIFFVRSGVEDDRTLPSFNAARSCAVPISELPATLFRTPSKTFGGSRPSGASCDCAFVEAATALINMSTTSNANRPCCPVVIDQLLFLRCKQSARLPSIAGFIESRGLGICWLGC